MTPLGSFERIAGIRRKRYFSFIFESSPASVCVNPSRFEAPLHNPPQSQTARPITRAAAVSAVPAPPEPRRISPRPPLATRGPGRGATCSWQRYRGCSCFGRSRTWDAGLHTRLETLPQTDTQRGSTCMSLLAVHVDSTHRFLPSPAAVSTSSTAAFVVTSTAFAALSNGIRLGSTERKLDSRPRAPAPPTSPVQGHEQR